jgi:predicted nucleic acid-binding protein
MMTEFPNNARIYVDTNVFIHWVERVGPMQHAVESMLGAVNRAHASLVTSQLVVAECLYLPSRDDNAALTATYDTFFSSDRDLEVLPFDGELVIHAARVGGKLGLKLLDAVHFVTARRNRCSWFLTCDARFRSAEGITVCRLDDWSPSP